jgi:putative holliday junction resolvase
MRDNPERMTEAEQSAGNPGARRLLGLDVGARRIGVAVSDELGLTAQAVDTIVRTNKRTDLHHVRRFLERYGATEIVVGHPLHMSGSEGRQAQKAAEFAEELRAKFALPVHLWDERLTTAEAERVLKQTSMGIERRREVIDQLAAVLILQSWLDAKR